MRVPAGDLNRRVTFRRRAALALTPGAVRGGFADHGTPVWAAFKPGRPRERVIAGFPLSLRSGLLVVLDSAFTRGLTRADQAVIGGEVYEIEEIARPDRDDGSLRLTVVSSPMGEDFSRIAEHSGEVVTVRRVVPNGAPIEAAARAIITGYTADELVGGIQQGDRKIILMAEDLRAQNFPEPVRPPDRIRLRGSAPGSVTLTVSSADDSTFRHGGVLHAYLIRATG